MSTIFVSHATTDDALIDALRLWLTEHGFTDVFVDHHDIRPGEKWTDRLRVSAGACRVVICLVSEEWLASFHCFSEFMAAWYMGKRILPLFLTDPQADRDPEPDDRLARVRAQDQGLDVRSLLSGGALDFSRDETVAAQLREALRAAGAATQVGLDPEVFEIDEARREDPFPGLASFGDDNSDAGLFFGRSREIADCLEDLRKMRVENDQRPMVILGASGSGKSSLLKAGIIPRLRREAPAWIPVRAFRPGADPLFNFTEALASALADFGVREASGSIEETLMGAWRGVARKNGEITDEGWAELTAKLEEQGAALRAAAGRPAASILISIDQSEELARSDGGRAEALVDYLRAAMHSTESDWQLAFTIRTDSFPELQRHRRFQDLKARGYDLRALPVFRFDEVVASPARRCGIEIDPKLIDRLMEDAPQSDALPMLAFAMQRLWRRFRHAGRITLANYEDLGGLSRMIDDAAERALRGISPSYDAPLPRREPSERLLKLGAETFVPPLAQINDEGEPIRRVVRLSEFSDDAKEMLEHFASWRLVVTRGGLQRGEETVEVSHEALFREWVRLKEWLKPQRTRLESLRELETAATIWDRRKRVPAYIAHLGPRLVAAEGLRADPRFAAMLSDVDEAYLDASRDKDRSQRRKRRLTGAGLGALVLLVGVVSIGFVFKKEVETWWFLNVQLRPYLEADLADLSVGDTLQDCRGIFETVPCPTLVVLPRGEFQMGSPGSEGHDDERPRHTVAIAHRMAVADSEITFDAWNLCVDHGGPCKRKDSLGWGEGQRPVINVSWDDAKTYIGWLNKVLGLDPDSASGAYRLLTEAEWEYAARAGSETAWHFGDDKANLIKYAWFLENSNERTQPVREKSKNSFGLFDMHGNVWELVEDCYVENYNDAEKDGSAWTDAACDGVVMRGGSWQDEGGRLRSAQRGGLPPDFRNKATGFRVARTINN